MKEAAYLSPRNALRISRAEPEPLLAIRSIDLRLHSTMYVIRLTAPTTTMHPSMAFLSMRMSYHSLGEASRACPPIIAVLELKPTVLIGPFQERQDFDRVRSCAQRVSEASVRWGFRKKARSIGRCSGIYPGSTRRFEYLSLIRLSNGWPLSGGRH